MAESHLQTTFSAGVAEVRLHRPHVRNAITFAMFEELAECAEDLAGRDDLRAVLLTGAGESFCAGLDTGTFDGDGGPATTSERMARVFRDPTQPDPGHDGNLFQHAINVWCDVPVPVVAAVQGHALGAGLQLALAADVRVVAPDAQLSALEIRWGLVPDLGGIRLLHALVGPEVTADLVMTGRMVSGREAHEIGLAARLAADPVAAGRELATELAAKSPDAVRQAKRLIRAAPGRSRAVHLADEARVLGHLQRGPNHREAVRAASEKRPPRFSEALAFAEPTDG